MSLSAGASPLLSERLLTVFRRQVVGFLDELIAQFPDEGDLVLCRIYASDGIKPIKLMARAVAYILPHEQKIRDKDESYFLTDNDMFSSLDDSRKTSVGRLKRIWVSNKLGDGDRATMWAWFQAFAKMTRRYQEAKKEEAISRGGESGGEQRTRGLEGPYLTKKGPRWK